MRIDFAGGWTDVDIFALGSGGAVLSATINQYVEGSLRTQDTGLEEPVMAPGVPALSISYHSDLPSGSGLGTSAALNLVWLSLIQPGVRSDHDRAHLAELACQLESMLGILGGNQDQYAAAFGGFLYMTFGETVTIERLELKPEIVKELEERLILCYTGQPRLSGHIHQNVWSAFRQGVPETVTALYRLRDCAVQMRDALLEENLAGFAYLLGQNWEYQKALDASVTNPQEALFQVAQAAGALTGKACGAGGGGCLLFCAAPGRQETVSSALAGAGAQVIPFRFESKGLQVTR